MKLSIITLAALGAVSLKQHDKDTGGSSGANAITKAMEAAGDDPDAQLLAGIKAAGAALADLNTKSENWHKDTKEAAKELTTLKNHFDGLDSTAKEFETKLKKFELAMHRERSMAFGDPLQRIAADGDQRTLLNAQIRAAAKVRFPELKLSDAHTKALGEGSGLGAAEIQSAINRNVYDLLTNYGIWNTLDVQPLSTLTTKFPVQTADPIATFIDEAGAISDDTNITGTSVNADADKIGVLLKVSRELLQDGEVDVTGQVLRSFARAVAKTMDHAAFVADGDADATDGGNTGIFQAGTLVTAQTGNTTMELLELEDITSVLINAPVELFNRASKWWMHPYILTRLLHIKDTNGRPIFLTAMEAPTPQGIGSILGFPVIKGAICPTTNTAGSRVLAFGDGDAFVVGVRQGIEIMASEHAYFANDQIGFRGITRAGFKMKAATGIQVLRTATS